MLGTATALMGRVERALRFYRYAAVALAVVVALLCAGGAGLYSMQRQQCQAGNAYRASDQQGWDEFILIALGPHPRPAAAASAAQLRAYIAGLDRPRACPPRLLP